MRSLHVSFLVSSIFLATVLSAQSPLTIVNNSFPTGAVGQNYAQALTATGGISPYTWAANGQIPPGLVFNSVGTISGKPTVGGTYPFTLIVTDARQTTVAKALSIVISGPGPAALSITTTTLPAGAVGQAYSQTLAATGGTPPYQWAAGPAFPAFLALDTISGTVSGTPTSGGTFSFPIQVADSANHTSTSTVTLTVNSPPISITTLAPIFNGTVAVPYVQTFRAAGGNPPYTWAITQGDPGGLSINATTGDLQGTPQTAGTFNFTVQAADRSGATATQSYSLVINPPTLLITVVSPLPAGAVGVAYSQKLPVAVSGGTPPYTWSVTAGSVPGLTFDPPAQPAHRRRDRRRGQPRRAHVVTEGRIDPGPAREEEMAGNSKRRGAVRKEGTKKGMVVGSGGQRRRGLEGKGPTPPAERRPGHPKAAARRAQRQARRDGPTEGRGQRRRPGDGETPETVLGRNPVVECLRAGVPALSLTVAVGSTSDERDRRGRAPGRRAGRRDPGGAPRRPRPDLRRRAAPGRRAHGAAVRVRAPRRAARDRRGAPSRA